MKKISVRQHKRRRPSVVCNGVDVRAVVEQQTNDVDVAVVRRSHAARPAVVVRSVDVRAFFEQQEITDMFEDDELVNRLIELRESLREHFDVGATLEERLADAVNQEQYELAARLRDEMQRRGFQR